MLLLGGAMIVFGVGNVVVASGHSNLSTPAAAFRPGLRRLPPGLPGDESFAYIGIELVRAYRLPRANLNSIDPWRKLLPLFH